MSRKPRYHALGAFYHVMLRGNDGQKIFYNDTDRCRMCLLIQQGVERYHHRIHAFCFMSNHIHLLVQVGHIPISKIVHNLAFRYSQYFNTRYQKVGHLFQGRFKSILLNEEDYLLRLVRYIHMNPVRAKLVTSPDAYFWSGHNAYLGTYEITWLTMEYTLSKFTNVLGESRRLYSKFIVKKESEEELNELRGNFKDGQVLGNDNFIENIRDLLKNEIKHNLTIEVIVEAVCSVFDIDRDSLCSPSQARKASLARGVIVMESQANGIRIEDAAKVLRRDGSTLSSLLSRFLIKYKECSDLRNDVEKVRIKVNDLADLQA